MFSAAAHSAIWTHWVWMACQTAVN